MDWINIWAFLKTVEIIIGSMIGTAVLGWVAWSVWKEIK